MKRLIYILSVIILTLGHSCKESDNSEPVYSVKVQLVYPNGEEPVEGVKVTATNNTSKSKAEIKTNADGIAVFELAKGTYSFMATERRSMYGAIFLFNGTKDLNISNNWKKTDAVDINLTQSKTSQLIVKELYTGGVQKDDGFGFFSFDKYIILYNNSEIPVKITKDFALATTMPYNTIPFSKYIVAGKLIFEKEGWLPSGQGVWYFNREVEVAPYSQIVIAINQAIDHTQTYSNSINFANPEYFCLYDISSGMNNKLYYVAPSEQIPSENYLKGINYGTKNAWFLSWNCPGFFIFSTKDISLTDFVATPSNTDFYGDSKEEISKKVPREWIIDGIEVFRSDFENAKRFTDDVDAGYVFLTTTQGYSIYRNVDKDATEAIPENAGKLVYNYSLGTENTSKGSTDPSGIDAEASIKNGAKIIYKDTNNSTEDFHQRAKASLRTN